MKTPITPWIDLMLDQAQRGQQLAWFLYGWFEREQRLNLDACVAWWVRRVVSPAGRSGSSRRDGPHAAATAGATTAGARPAGDVASAATRTAASRP